MRKLQRSFYRGKDRQILLAAKAAEFEVDDALEQLGLLVHGQPAKEKPKPKSDPKLF